MSLEHASRLCRLSPPLMRPQVFERDGANSSNGGTVRYDKGSLPMSLESLQRDYPDHAGHRHFLITDVTRMSAGQVCVASIDLHTKKIARPLQWNHSNWPETLVDEGLTPGRIVRQRIRKEQNPQGLPHETEDVQLTDNPQILGTFLGEPELFAVLLPVVDPSVASIFGEALVGHKFVPEHSRVRSLGRVRADARSVTLYLDHDRPRIVFRDGQTDYDVPVTDLRVRTVSDAGAIEVVKRAIKTAASYGGAMIIGLGLARPWAGSSNDFSPRRCYLQANGLTFPFESGLARRLG